jgi:Family of unknown function (DUF6776)
LPKNNRYKQIIGLVAIILIAFGDGLLLGRYLGNEAGRRTAAESAKLREQLESVRAAHALLQQKAAILEGSSELDRLALVNAQNALTELQEALSEARKDLELYRRIGLSDDPDAGLTVQDFQVLRDGGLQYRLTLLQGGSAESEVSGKVEITIIGRIDGAQRTLALQDFDKEHANGHSFAFQYYQLLSGTILWPEGFVPETVEIRVVSQTPGVGNVTKRWAWKEVAAG